MKIKQILASAFAVLLVFAAGCEVATEVPVNDPIFEIVPMAAPTAEPAPVITPEPERPMLESTDMLITALANLGIDIDPQEHQTVEKTIVFMVKLLGQEKEALKRNFQHPYSDVSAEASPYVGYAYATWLLTGKPGDTLGAQEEADETLLISMLMRGMGYTEDNEDNEEQTLAGGGLNELAASIGITGEGADVPLRGDNLAHILWAALSAKNKNGDTLAEQLMDEDVFSSSDYKESGYFSRGETPPKPEKRRAETEYENTAPIKPPITTSDNYGGSSGGGSSGGGSSGGGSSGGGSSGGGSSGGGGDSGGGGGDSGGGGGDSGGGGGDSGGDTNEMPSIPNAF